MFGLNRNCFTAARSGSTQWESQRKSDEPVCSSPAQSSLVQSGPVQSSSVQFVLSIILSMREGVAFLWSGTDMMGTFYHRTAQERDGSGPKCPNHLPNKRQRPCEDAGQ